MVQILLNFIKFTCTGDWPLHMQASERMLKLFFAYRPSCLQHLTYYWVTQQKFKMTHPNIYEKFMLGNFSVEKPNGSLTNYHQMK